MRDVHAGRPARTLLAGILAVLLAGAGCGGEAGSAAGEADGDDAPRTGGTVVAGVPTDATSLLPPLARTSLDAELSALLFPGLNRGVWEPGGLTYPEDDPLALARSRRLGSDGTTLTYRLEDDLRWSDGEPLTAEDVAFTYRMLAHRDAGLPLSYVTSRMDSVVTLGDTAVTFHFARRYPGMLFDTGVGILPEHVYGEVPPAEFMGLSGRATGTASARGDSALVVSGPFRLAEWSRGERVVLVRNVAGITAPRLDTLVFRILPEETTRLAELRAGRLDLARLDSYREANRLSARDGVRILRMPRRAYDYIAWNPAGHPAFGDPRVREALSLALDREEILAALDMGQWAEPAAGPYGPLFPQLRVPADSARHDPDRARALLEEAGWSRSGDAEVRSRNGRALRFELATQAGSDRRTSALELIRGELGAVGAEAEVRTQEFNSLFSRMRSGDYQAALLGWQVGLDPDISPFWRDPASPLNVVSYDDPGVAARIDSALAAPTRGAAAPHWRRAAREIAADHPYAFLWYFDVLYAARDRLRGADVHVTGLAADAHRWWVTGPRP